MAQASYRVNVQFSESVYQTLMDLARRRGKTKAETLRDVIALAKWLDEARAQGGHILVERDGKIRELVTL